jgi:hypothetical protein
MGLPDSSERLRKAVVLATTEEVCTVFANGDRFEVPYASQFPRPRVERVSPGHLVAIADTAAENDVVVWRWFDAVVLDTAAGSVILWEPGHGSVHARPRDPDQLYHPGTRAYLSAGLPEADWWACAPVQGGAEFADVDLDEVDQFLAGIGLFTIPAD